MTVDKWEGKIGANFLSKVQMALRKLRLKVRGLMILKPRGASAQAAAHSHLPRVWREAGMEGR